MASDAEMRQCADDRLFYAVDIFLDVVVGTPQVDERVGDHLARPMKSHLAAPVGGRYGDVSGLQQMLGSGRDALGEYRWVLTNPELIVLLCAALRGKLLHGGVCGCIRHPAKAMQFDGHLLRPCQRTTLTSAWEVKAK